MLTTNLRFTLDDLNEYDAIDILPIANDNVTFLFVDPSIDVLDTDIDDNDITNLNPLS